MHGLTFVHDAVGDQDRTFRISADPTDTVAALPRVMFAIVADGLSEREREVVALISEGQDNASIARELYISEATVRCHLKKIRDKLGLRRSEGLLLAVAGCEGLVFDWGGPSNKAANAPFARLRQTAPLVVTPPVPVDGRVEYLPSKAEIDTRSRAIRLERASQPEADREQPEDWTPLVVSVSTAFEW